MTTHPPAVGPDADPVPRLGGRGMTLADQLARHARAAGDRLALTFEHRLLTWDELDERVSRLAGALRGRGVAAGDRVAVLGPNRPEVLEAFLACTRLGALAVPVNFRLVPDEIAYVLTDSGARAMVVDAALSGAAASAREQAPDLTVVLTLGGDPGAAGPGAEDYETALAATSASFEAPDVDERGPAFVMYTSGTTGRPKGAVLTHHNLLVHAFSTMAHLGAPPEDRVWLAAAPLFHIAGLSGLLPTLLRGGRIVLLPSGRFDAAELVDLLETERVSSVFLVPSQWQAVCAVPDLARRDLSALRRLSWGAAPASTTLLRTLIDAFPQAEVTTAFGQTECSPVTMLLRGEDSVRKLGSIGTPMLNVEVRVVDDDGRDVPVGSVGEIVYRGPTIMIGYWGRPVETAEAFRGGWFHSGDLVREDDDGYYWVVDRKKDMIISGGENIYCAEVEDVLAAHPRVAEVAVVGVPDERWGEAPLAVVAPRDPAVPPDPAELEAWCEGRLARYKHPRRLALVAALPRNASGKVRKTVLRDDVAAGRLAVSGP